MIRKLKRENNILILCLILSLGMHLIFGIEGTGQVKEMQYKLNKLEAQLQDKQEQIEILEIILKNQEQDASEPMATEPEYIGTFTVTHYCLENYPHICNDGESLYTASGQAPIPYYTIAADESIPFGTKLVIDSKEYEVMDRGGAITTGRLDIAVQTHDEALRAGVVQADVWIVEVANDKET